MKNSRKLLKKIAALAAILLFVTSCFLIKSVDQPSYVEAGETMTVTVNAAFDSEDNGADYKILLFGMLVPKSWDASNNASVRYDSDHNENPDQPGSGAMTFDEGDLTNWKSQSKGANGQASGNTWAKDMEEILGTGENYGEMEWVAFYSDKFIDGSNAAFDGTVTIQIKAGDQHTGTQLGYFIGHVGDGLKFEEGGSTPEAASKFYDVEFTDCLSITNVAADATNLCGSAPTFAASIGPENYLFDDIITVKFDAKEGFNGANTALFNTNEVFACATAMFSDGTTIVKCERDSASKMTLTGDNVQEFAPHLDFYPTQRFIRNRS